MLQVPYHGIISWTLSNSSDSNTVSFLSWALPYITTRLYTFSHICLSLPYLHTAHVLHPPPGIPELANSYSLWIAFSSPPGKFPHPALTYAGFLLCSSMRPQSLPLTGYITITYMAFSSTKTQANWGQIHVLISATQPNVRYMYFL